jgi:hypothetical protein
MGQRENIADASETDAEPAECGGGNTPVGRAFVTSGARRAKRSPLAATLLNACLGVCGSPKALGSKGAGGIRLKLGCIAQLQNYKVKAIAVSLLCAY